MFCGNFDIAYTTIQICYLWKNFLNSKYNKLQSLIFVLFLFIAPIATYMIDDLLQIKYLLILTQTQVSLFGNIWYLIYYTKLEVKTLCFYWKYKILKDFH